MNLTQFLLILKARLKIIFIVFGFVLLTTLIINLLLPKIYKATSSIVLNYKGTDPVTGLTVPAQLMPGYIATQIDIITSHNVALKVVEKLKLVDNQQAQVQFKKATDGKGSIKDYFADKFLGGLEAKPSRESSVIEISYSSADPDFSATMANAFAEAYQETTIQLKVEPSQLAAEFLDEKTKLLRTKLEEAQLRLSKYQQEKGLTSVMGNLDVESARLNELSSQLVAAQSQSFDSASRKKRSTGNTDESPDVAANPMVQNLKISIASGESKLSELAQRLGSSHPNYQAAEAEVNKLKSQLLEATTRAKLSISGNASINKELESELKASVSSQKARVLELNLARDQLEVLQADVQNAQRAVDLASQRFTQTTLEGSSNQADIAVLNPATPPLFRTSPRIMFNLILASFFGSFLGIGSALFAESIDKRIRRKEDSSDLLQIPVLVVIKSKQHKFLPMVMNQMSGLLSKLNGSKPFKYSKSKLVLSGKANRYLNDDKPVEEAIDPFNSELISIKQPTAQQVESLRLLRGYLLKKWFNTGCRSLGIVSANSNEGSSYLAANLAIVFAQLGKRTLLIDANLREPRQHLIFNIKEIAGLSEILAGETLTMSETFDNLYVLVAGNVSTNSHESLSRESFTNFMKIATSQYEVVIVDSAPVGLYSDAQDVLANCEGTLVVSRLNHTKFSDLVEIKNQIEVSGAKPVGSVINDY
jgi:polysaccharide biosynthesis transport protein